MPVTGIMRIADQRGCDAQFNRRAIHLRVGNCKDFPNKPVIPALTRAVRWSHAAVAGPKGRPDAGGGIRYPCN